METSEERKEMAAYKTMLICLKDSGMQLRIALEGEDLDAYGKIINDITHKRAREWIRIIDAVGQEFFFRKKDVVSISLSCVERSICSTNDEHMDKFTFDLKSKIAFDPKIGIVRFDQEGKRWKLGDACKVDGHTKNGLITSFSTSDWQVRVFFEDGSSSWHNTDEIYRLDHIRVDADGVACEAGQTVYFVHPDLFDYSGPMTIERLNDCRHEYVIVKTAPGRRLDVPACELTHEPVVDPRVDLSEETIRQITGCARHEARNLREYLLKQGVAMRGWDE